MFCKYCGEKIQGSMGRCSRCGHELDCLEGFQNMNELDVNVSASNNSYKYDENLQNQIENCEDKLQNFKLDLQTNMRNVYKKIEVMEEENYTRKNGTKIKDIVLGVSILICIAISVFLYIVQADRYRQLRREVSAYRSQITNMQRKIETESFDLQEESTELESEQSGMETETETEVETEPKTEVHTEEKTLANAENETEENISEEESTSITGRNGIQETYGNGKSDKSA